MEQTMTMKTLTKIRLINWHYFTNETIKINCSALFSGENASGKSTILDAIQLVLTTNSRRFNPAANEKSKRNLQGYIRCKTGEEGNNYVRGNGPVISYVALEFYEQSKEQYFVLGVKIESHDVDDEPSKKWFHIEGELDSLTFIVDGKPALEKQFTQQGRKIQFETQVAQAKDDFRVRLGRLDDKFSDMIIKSMAFKPMDKVKDFINKFILPENRIETVNLQGNIRNLRELQKLVQNVKMQIEQLKIILEQANTIDEIDYKKLVIEILLKLAALEKERDNLQKYELELKQNELSLLSLNESIKEANKRKNDTNKRLLDLRVTLNTNETGRLIENIKKAIDDINNKIKDEKNNVLEFEEQIKNLKNVLKYLPIKENINVIDSGLYETDEKINNLNIALNVRDSRVTEARNENGSIYFELKNICQDIERLETQLDNLRKNRITHNTNTTNLQKQIDDEFLRRGIDSRALVFSDLLEMKDAQWQNAVEGYLNTQRFNIIVEPKYYDIAADVYNRNKDRIHSVGLVNTEKIMLENNTVEIGSLAEKIVCENRYGRAYANYLLGRVVCCETVDELKKYTIAITKTCMKYQGHVLQKIDESIYRMPFIGQNAIKIQLENAQQEYNAKNKEKERLIERRKENENLISLCERCDFKTILNNINCRENLKKLDENLEKERENLFDAENNPTFIDLQMKLSEAENANKDAEECYSMLLNEAGEKKAIIENCKSAINVAKENVICKEKEKNEAAKNHEKALAEAETKYNENSRKNSAGTIFENFGPRLATLNNNKTVAMEHLWNLQKDYKDGDFGTGMENISFYRDDLSKLEKTDLISYEDKLKTAQDNCELEFRENFLAKMRENIGKAEEIFRNLNSALRGIYYGNDSYKFELSANKEKQSLYEMITSDVNVSGQTLFTSVFQEKYHAEMDDLFSKLTDENLNETSIVNDLTDYRSYLDYDIKIISRDGKIQLFSKTYGEKSGGETQTPYYVAIAASFAQMYSGRETTRIIILDEAFNNMDEDRTASMMQFFKSQNFQVILACPPAKMEIIGEYVDSVYLTIHKDNFSVVEEYFL